MSSEGSVTKRCTCTDPATNKRLGGRCPKLRRAGGSWHPTHGSWAYQLELPITAAARRRQLRRSGFDTREAAAAERDHARTLLALAGDDRHLQVQIGDLLHRCRRGTPLPDTDTVATRIRTGLPASVATTTADYLTGWLHRRRTLAEKTRRSYGDHIQLYLIPHLGNVPVQDLDRRHIEAMFTALHARNTQIRAGRASRDPAERATYNGVRPLGPGSMQRLRATLRKALNDCMRRDKLRTDNPAVGIELASGRPPRARVWTDRAVARWMATGQRPSPVMVWTPAQAGRFLDVVERREPALYPLYVLILHRGLRRGEACGLPDHEVDLDLGHLSVVQQITEVGHTPITCPVKSDASERDIPLGSKTIAVLRAYLRQRARWQQAAGAAWPDTGLFFVRPDGRAWHPQYISRRFDTLVRKAGLPPVRLYDLRHCAATYLRHGGADLKEVQETLGHANISVTADIYTSVVLELRSQHADASADLIPRHNSDTDAAA